MGGRGPNLSYREKDKWQDLVNKIMNNCIPLISGNLLKSS